LTKREKLSKVDRATLPLFTGSLSSITMRKMTATKGQVQFKVGEPGRMIIRVVASPDDYCRVILKLFPRAAMTLIYKGEILDLNATLGSYGIAEGELVVAVATSTSATPEANRWLQITRSRNDLEDSVQGLFDASVRPEIMRLRDIARLRMESGRREIRQVAWQWRESHSHDVLRNNEPSVIPERPLYPSTAPLNATWK
jgi:hypothetical protein